MEEETNVEKITWIWDNTDPDNQPQASFIDYSQGDTEIKLSKNQGEKWFSSKLEKSWIQFKSGKFKAQDLDVFARLGNNFYQQLAPNVYYGMFIFTLTEQDVIMIQEGKWVKIKRENKSKTKPNITQLKDFMF